MVILVNALQDMVRFISYFSMVVSYVYPLLLTFLDPFLPPLPNLCKLISSQQTYDL